MTGLIYVAIVALWAAVLIPMWLRRHDAGEAHRLERHQEAMGILARFRNGGTVEGTPARRAARRRRAIVATLVAVTVTGAVAWVLQVAGAWAVILPGSALLVFVASAAWATRTSSRPSMERSARRSATSQRVQEREEARDEARDEAWAHELAQDRAQEQAQEQAQDRARERERRRAQRRERVAAAEQGRHPQTESRTRRSVPGHEVIVTAPPRTQRDRVALEGTAIDEVDTGRDTGRETGQAMPGGRRRADWDQVFDQTA